MPDEADLAADAEEEFLAVALDKVRRAAHTPWVPEFQCLNCDADLPSAKQRFCDHYCAADWQQRREIQRRQRGG